MAASRKNPTDALSLRITVIDPPPGIAWALQLGREDLVRPTAGNKSRISFDFTVEVVPASAPGSFRLRGPAVQGKPGERFVYLCIGAYAGQSDAPAGWRAKISIEGITRELLNAVRSKKGGILEAQFAGTAKDGGPSRASVPLLGGGWKVVA